MSRKEQNVTGYYDSKILLTWNQSIVQTLSDFYLYLKHLSQRKIINNLPSKSLIITKRNKDLLRKQKMV